MTARDSHRAPLALIAGGGSGGHVFPALAVGEELGRRGWRLGFAGVAGGMEERLVAERGLPFHPLPARPLLGRGPLDRLRALWTLVRSTLAARRLVHELGAAAVVGTGGYVSAPAVLGAALARVPALLVEPNAVAGLANRWLSRWAAEAAVAFESTIAGLRCPATVTGVPVRAAFAALPAEAPTTGPLRLLVLGGSQGAQQLNRTVPAALAAAARRPGGLPEVSVLHQAGPSKVDDAAAAYEEAGQHRETSGAEIVPFIADTAAALGAAHLVISRSGAITSAEICTAGRASVLVPLTAAAGHQRHNAEALAAAGAAVVLPGERLTADELGDVLAALLTDRPRLAAMGRAARRLARPGAAAVIADRVEALAGVDGSNGDDRPAMTAAGRAA